MRIVPYPELVEKDQMFRLQYQGLHLYLDYRDFDKRMEWDPWLRGGLGGFCGVDDGRLLGIVGVYDIPTRSLDGRVLVVGGVWALVTDPSATRRGVFTALMEESHRYFRDRGCPFAFLYTYRSWVSHRIYLKLGYQEVRALDRFPNVFKLLDQSKSRQAQEHDTPSATNEDVSALFAQFTANRTGFVVRSQDFLGLLARRGQVDPAQTVKVDGGYALFSEHSRYREKAGGMIYIRELVAMDRHSQEQLLEAIEMRAHRGVVDPVVPDEGLVQGYLARDYSLASGDYKVLMAKALQPGVTIEKV